MKQMIGNLIDLAKDNQFDVILHGCNCFNTMGAGIAKYIKQEFPKAYEVDCKTEKGDKNKLGTFSAAKIKINEKDLIVCNCYTQYHYNSEDKPVDYDAIVECMKLLKSKVKNSGKRIGYPKIGCGLAGGNWDIVSAIIDKYLEGEDHTLVVLPDDL